MSDGIRVQRLRVRAYRGIAETDMAIPPEGAVFAGRNGAGKTSILSSLQAALAGVGIGPEAIRVGEKTAEILVDLNEASVRRVITQRGTKIDVTGPDGESKTLKWLEELLGTSAIDPITLFTEKDKKRRRAKILEALPARVTDAHLRTWLGERYDQLPKELREKALFLHGIEAVTLIREHFYVARTAANARAKALSADLEVAQETLERLMASEPASPKVVSLVQKSKKAPPSVQECEALLARAAQAQAETMKVVNQLEALARQAAAQDDKSTRAREQIATARANATKFRAQLAELPAIDLVDVEARVASAKQDMDEAAYRYNQAMRESEAAHEAQRRRDETARIAADHEHRANDLEAILKDSAVSGPTLQELGAANEADAQARAEVDKAQSTLQASKVAADVAAKLAVVRAAELEAGGLDALVTLLSRDATTQLIQESNGIPGLAIDGDDIKLDGVSLDSLCGQESLCFAVDVAKRANARAKLLIVDGLERLDPTQLEVFLDSCLRDGYQVIGTRVADGDIVIEALSKDTQEAAS